MRGLATATAIGMGVVLGLGAFTFRYADGLAYLSNRPAACANCHVMRDYLDAWQKSSHHARATCNDCHTPHAIGPKLVTKAENGWRHSEKFTLQSFREPLRITPANEARLEHNCIRCHGEVVDDIRLMAGDAQGEQLRCPRCHGGVGHGARG